MVPTSFLTKDVQHSLSASKKDLTAKILTNALNDMLSNSA